MNHIQYPSYNFIKNYFISLMLVKIQNHCETKTITPFTDKEKFGLHPKNQRIKLRTGFDLFGSCF